MVVGAVYRPPGTPTTWLRGAVCEHFEMALAAGKPVGGVVGTPTPYVLGLRCIYGEFVYNIHTLGEYFGQF